MRKLIAFLIVSAIGAVAYSTVMAQSTIGVGDVATGRVAVTAFTLNSEQKLNVRVNGGAFHAEDWKMVVYYGWIIDSETRKTVWHAADEIDRDRDFEFGEFEVKDEVTLSKGTYEVYFASSFHYPENNWSFNGVSSLVDQVFGDRKRERVEDRVREGMGITISGNLSKADASSLHANRVNDAIVVVTKPNHNANVKKGFSLSAETTLRIYAIGEGNRDETFDYAWIYDVNTRKRVWVMDYANSNFAGGAKKNLRVDETITLPAGNYMVSYVSDDSHGYNEWNAMPPDDPEFTGIVVWAKNKSNVVPFKMPEEVKPVLQLTQVRDDDYVSKGLTVKSKTDLRLLCLGEESSSGGMADYGWIMNASTREVVWDMSEVRREHAGGAEKNKMVDAMITLEKGEYIVYYVTDDSHSYRDWNSGPPHEQDYYGISLWVNKKEDISKVALFEPSDYKNDKVVVEIVRVRDDEHLAESFTLDQDTKLRVIAMGESDDDEMADYGWIKNMDTGKVVWEMTYRNTESAGGASKNRLYNDTIILPKGNYKVYYETDGSHSYRRWNASPPRDPERYGISLVKEM